MSGLKVDRVRLHPVKGTKPSPSPSPTESSTTPAVPPRPAPRSRQPSPDDAARPRYRLPAAPCSAPASTRTDARGPRRWPTRNAAYGGMEVVRVFYPGLPSKWPGRAGEVGGSVVVSFKANPSDVLAGRHDAYLAEWFRTAPRDRDIWWIVLARARGRRRERGLHGAAVARRLPTHRGARRCGRQPAAAQHRHPDVLDGQPEVGPQRQQLLPGQRTWWRRMGWDCYAHSTLPLRQS